LPDNTPPKCHAEESEDSDTFGARFTSSDSTAPLSPDHPLTHTLPTLVPFLCKTARMAVRVPPTMSPGLSTNLPSQKRSQGTYELVEDDKEEDKEEEDVEAEESSDFDSESEDAEDEGPAAGDEGLAVGYKGPGMRVESLGLGGDEAVPKGQQWAAPVVKTTVGEPLGLGYGALRRQEIASREGEMSSVFEVGQGSGSVSELERP
ncbi:hypothetical protein Tco_1529963, partial [Tanacetum coccineum]